MQRPPVTRRASGSNSGAQQRRGSVPTNPPAAKAQRQKKIVALPLAPQTKPPDLEDDQDLTLGYETDAGVTIRDKKSRAERMSKEERERAGEKRMTAYYIGSSFKMKLLASFLKQEHNVLPRAFDEALYVIYHLPLLPGYSNANVRSSVFLGKAGKSMLSRLSEAEDEGYHDSYFMDSQPPPLRDGYMTSSPVESRQFRHPGFELSSSVSDTEPESTETETTARRTRRPQISEPPPPEEDLAEVVFFEYGVVVFFGLTENEEKSILQDVENVVVRKIIESEWEIESCHFAHDPAVLYPRVWNDFFTLKSRSHLLKLSIAHAIGQSTLLARVESNAQRVLTAPMTLAIPQQLAKSGALQLKRNEALKLTGRLFKLRQDITSNILDVPELFWSDPSLKLLYDSVKDYMEIEDRVQALNEKLAIASDFLDAIHDHLNNSAMERITYIIIWLIVAAVLVELGELVARLIVHSTGEQVQQAVQNLSREEALLTLERMIS
ncbi:DUF155-domain-containing protein [Mycena floridula]|nr:DUF155-domain-containing protein [Mycena floridula]